MFDEEYRDPHDECQRAFTMCRMEKDRAYAERNKLVCLLSKVFPASIQDHVLKDGEKWDKDWHKVIYILLPTGQCSWHIHTSEVPMFSHLKNMGFVYDGHTTEEKYKRVEAVRDNLLCIVDMDKMQWDENAP